MAQPERNHSNIHPDLPGRCGQGYLWAASVPGQGVVYEWHASRAARCLDSLLGSGYQGKLQSDGYSAYPAFVKNKEVELFGCWAHYPNCVFIQSDSRFPFCFGLASS
jgi:hypothetical protein